MRFLYVDNNIGIEGVFMKVNIGWGKNRWSKHIELDNTLFKTKLSLIMFLFSVWYAYIFTKGLPPSQRQSLPSSIPIWVFRKSAGHIRLYMYRATCTLYLLYISAQGLTQNIRLYKFINKNEIVHGKIFSKDIFKYLKLLSEIDWLIDCD